MLNLSRRVGEKIKIGDDITILIIEIEGRQVVVGVDAPRSIPVHREEIWQELKDEEAEVAEEKE
ncbi:MAG: carbon storage regulator CsrA [Candidatus Komeilibacteria bacterium]|jgi:carbon storage regulator|nr:carbon storage regulator CsrA [Candidatus Komeilibacteria bacterium]MBT4447146.1 carbon storage regulator CsrA [Candidatus Komeilibacteria bacterium]